MASTLEQAILPEVVCFASGSTAALSGTTGILGAAQRNAQADATLLGYPKGKWRFSGTFASAVGSNQALYVYFAKGDSTGTVYETSSVLSPPPGLPAASIPLDATNTVQVRDSVFAPLPPGYWKPILYNATGQQISAGWSLTLEPATDQGV